MWEETGIDIGDNINSAVFLKCNPNKNTPSKMYIITGVPESINLAPQVEGEIQVGYSLIMDKLNIHRIYSYRMGERVHLYTTERGQGSFLVENRPLK